MLLLVLNQTFKKKTMLEKVTINHSRSRYYYFEGSQHLCQVQHEHEKKQDLMINYNS